MHSRRPPQDWNDHPRDPAYWDAVPEAGGTPEILTAINGWPVREIAIDGKTIARPLIMEMHT